MKLRLPYMRAWVAGLALLAATPAGAAPYGKLSGVVVDPAGIPQMGATILVSSENGRGRADLQLLTNSKGVFTTERLLPGMYSVRVTLAGFMPAVQRHVRINANLATLLKVELDSLFTSIERMRRKPAQPLDTDEWAWILRTAAETRPVLRYVDGEVSADPETARAEKSNRRKPTGRVELTSGSSRPGSVSNQVDAPSSAFAYSQKLGRTSRLVMAGLVGYEQSASGGFTTTWLPAGEPGSGPETTLVLRQSNLNSGGPGFRGARMQQINQHSLGGRIHVRYGADYTVETLQGRSAVSVRPQGEVSAELAPHWRATMQVATAARTPAEQGGALEAAMGHLDSLPAVMVRNGRPVLENGWHQELNVERALGPKASMVAAVFRDRSAHTPIYGRGAGRGGDFFHDVFSEVFVYDGGESNTWGTRVAYRQKISEDFNAAVIYAWAGTLAPEEIAAGIQLRDALQTAYRHSLAARLSGRVPKIGTRFAASYKWVNGRVATRQDRYGEAALDVDSNLNFSLRQPLPEFLFFSGKFQALADFRNLLARGYVPVNTSDGQLVLIPAMRSIRGGVSFQF